jgi:hypothetical protein
MIWRNPVAWFGLATLLIPLAIHLLVRHRAEPRPFPSLRFVRPTRLASVRRKMISDWPLLVIRMAILALAVAAFADPLWQSAARRAEWNQRQARAIVVDATPSVTGASDARAANTGSSVAAGVSDAATDSVARSLVQREATSAFRAEAFETRNVADGIRRAASWLRTAPPARRELVVISDFQLGALDAAMLRDLPAHVGIRFVRTSAAPVTRTVDGQPRTQRTAAGAATNAAAAFTLRSPRVTLNAGETAVNWVDAPSPSPVEIDSIDAATITLRPVDLKLRGSAVDRPFLLAATEAVLAQGVPVAADAAGGRKSATIFISAGAAGSADEAAPGPRDAGVLTASWQVDAARAIATDASLARAAGRATTAASPRVAGATSAPRSSEVTAKSRAASSAPSEAPEPWIVLMRDAGGKPAVLAAADGANADARMLLWSRVSAADEATALLIRATLRALAGSDAFAEAEVIAIPDATLAEWQRPVSDPPPSEWRGVDSSDRRWLWGAVLVLLVAEQVLRRRARQVETPSDRKVLEHAA